MKAAAYVSDNRWVVMCSCHEGALVNERKIIVCGTDPYSDLPLVGAGCGQILEVSMPRNRRAIEEVLQRRPPPNRHWTHETVAQLRAEQEGLEVSTNVGIR